MVSDGVWSPCSGPAPKHGESGSLDYANAWFFNHLGWPAAVVRAGKTAEGVPLATQIIGRPWREDQVLALALKIENTSAATNPTSWNLLSPSKQKTKN